MTRKANHSMKVTRILEAPVASVWKVWTEAALVRRWWGPRGFTAPLAEMDVREGGTSLVCMRAPADFGGKDFFNTWTYARVLPLERLEFVQRFTDRQRRPVTPAELGLPPAIPPEVPHVLTFRPLGADRTELTIEEHGYPNAEIVAVSRSGMEQCLEKMSALLEAEGTSMTNPLPRVTGVLNVGIPVADPDRALEFYVGTLGLEKRVDAKLGPDGMRWIEVGAPGAETGLALIAAGGEIQAGVDTGVRVTTPDAAALHAALHSRQVPVGELLRWENVPPMFVLRDPDGNRLYVVEKRPS